MLFIDSERVTNYKKKINYFQLVHKIDLNLTEEIPTLQIEHRSLFFRTPVENIELFEWHFGSSHPEHADCDYDENVDKKGGNIGTTLLR